MLHLLASGVGSGSTIIMLVAMVAVFYFMLIRPENKRKKEAEEMCIRWRLRKVRTF